MNAVIGKERIVDIARIRELVSQPISEDNPVGISVADDSLYDFIEEQMMKVGSLSHGTVQWKKVEEAAITLLSEQTKDLKLLISLLQCFHHRNTSVSLTVSLFVLGDFVHKYWETCYPYAGKKGDLPRRKFFNQIVQRVELAVEKLDFNQCSADQLNELHEMTLYWDDIAEKIEFDLSATDAAIAKIRRLAREAAQRLELNKKSEAKKTTNAERTAPSSKSQSISINTDSDKTTKQALLDMANFLEEEGDAIELVVRMRRYAVWSGIDSLPEHKNNKSLVNAPPKDRTSEYWSLLDNADVDLWKRVETTLSMAPFWFGGQYLSYQIAQKLGYTSSAQAILQETQRFLKRWPELYDFTFRSGEPLFSDECKEWLETSRLVGNNNVESSNVESNNVDSGHVQSDDWASYKKQAIDLVKTDGLEVGLSMVNTAINNTKDLRSHAHWKLISAELLQEKGLHTLALEQLQSLHAQIESMTVSEWEPSILKRIEKYIQVK